MTFHLRLVCTLLQLFRNMILVCTWQIWFHCCSYQTESDHKAGISMTHLNFVQHSEVDSGYMTTTSDNISASALIYTTRNPAANTQLYTSLSSNVNNFHCVT